MDDGRPTENALVEVFNNPDYLLDENPFRVRPEQKSLAACRTALTANAVFAGYPPETTNSGQASTPDGTSRTFILWWTEKQAGSIKFESDEPGKMNAESNP
jgi:hypothetical protein